MPKQGTRVLRRATRASIVGYSLLGLAAFLWTGSAQSQKVSEGTKVERPNPSAETATVRLSPEQQKQIGLQTAVLEAAPHPEQFRAYGAVLDAARITELTNGYANAQAQLQTAQARLEVAKSAFERATNLVQSSAVAKKDVEVAEGTFRTDQAALAAAESQIKTIAATAQQEWGPVIGKAIVERSPDVIRLIERERLLVQVTLTPDIALATPPRTALAKAPARDGNIDLQYISSASRTDPRIQGLSYFFSAGGDSGLLPGMNTTVYVPSGKTYEGVFVEDTAIVRWQGRPWVYLRAGADTFKRYPIDTDQPVSDDDYVVRDIPPGSEIVMRGAQVLLSEEAKSELRGAGDDD